MIQFSLLTPNGELYSDQVEEVSAQGSDGVLGILPGHIPLVTALQVAPLRVRVKDVERRFAVYGGMLQVAPDKVTVLADDAELPEDIDHQAAQARREALQAQLQRAEPDERAALERELQAVTVQLEVVQ